MLFILLIYFNTKIINVAQFENLIFCRTNRIERRSRIRTSLPLVSQYLLFNVLVEHFSLQSEQARSEAYNIVSSAHQYLGPKDGMPLQGLIQVRYMPLLQGLIQVRYMPLLQGLIQVRDMPLLQGLIQVRGGGGVCRCRVSFR